jgi:hypothetical protein
VPEKVTTRVLYEAGRARAAADCLAFPEPSILWPCNMFWDYTISWNRRPEREIPVTTRSLRRNIGSVTGERW